MQLQYLSYVCKTNKNIPKLVVIVMYVNIKFLNIQVPFVDMH